MRLILIGGGGFSLELYTYLKDDLDQGRLPDIHRLALIDDSSECEVLRRSVDIQYLGPLRAFVPQPGDRALIAVGSPTTRRDLSVECERKSLPLHRYVHSTAWIAPNASLGQGVIIGPGCIVSAYAIVHANVAAIVQCGIGHGSTVGRHSVLGPFSVINGDASVGEGCLLGSRATLFPKAQIGVGCVVDSHCIVRATAGANKLISSKRADILLDNRLSSWTEGPS